MAGCAHPTIRITPIREFAGKYYRKEPEPRPYWRRSVQTIGTRQWREALSLELFGSGMITLWSRVSVMSWC